MIPNLVVTPGVFLPGRELSWTASRSGGPGGQNVNKVSTKIELRFDLAQNRTLNDGVKTRLRARAAGRLDASGRLVVTCDTTRSQSQNLELAREKLAELVRAALAAPKRRRATAPSRASRRRRLEHKRQTGEKKRGRSGGWDDG
ncbi:MAG TPA: alternative ribosome rescue aminoacyl-tRNA hydrolase ArfB [Polyangiaceae bacterium]